MGNLQEKIQLILNSGIYNLSAIEKNTEISRHLMKKISNGEKVPQYILIALNYYFNNLGK